MRRYSIAGRVVALVLAVEVLAALGVTGFAFFYERHAHFRSFEIGLKGRADTVMGAVEDADDAKLGVMLDTTDLKLPPQDVYVVREEGGAVLGQSSNRMPAAEWQGNEGYFSLEVEGRSYRGLRLHGVRVVDPMAANVRHRLTVLYASPTERMWEAVFGAVRVFALANGLLVLLTGLLVPAIVRRSLAPLHALAGDAGAITPRAWGFSPSSEVRRVAELQPLVGALEALIARLERSFTQQRQFVGDAAHELKTAVAVVKSSVQLLELRARTAAEYQAGLARCFADCLRLEELAQRMLLLARVEEAGPSDVTKATSLDAAVAAAVAELAPLAALQEVRLVGEETNEATVGLEAAMVRSLLVNLVTNAVQHSPSGSAVRVRVACTGSVARLAVEDCGDGITAEAVPFVFDRFYRGDPSRSRRTGGTGLGLAICKAIVESGGGSIRIESALGKGTKVFVELPIVPAPAIRAAVLRESKSFTTGREQLHRS